MVNDLITSQGGFQTALNYVLGAGTFGFIVTLIKIFLWRKKPKSDYELSDAKRQKTLAEARSLDAETRSKDVSSNKTASEVLLDLILALRESQRESLELEEKVTKLEAANKLMAHQIKDFQDKKRDEKAK